MMKEKTVQSADNIRASEQIPNIKDEKILKELQQCFSPSAGNLLLRTEGDK